MGVKKWVKGSRAVVSMLMVQVFATGLQILSKVILSEGTFIFALMTYRHVVGALCVAPFAFFFERGTGKKLSWLVWFWLFMNALTGISMAMGLFYDGLRDTTATYATNFLNLIPIVIFVFSTIAGFEKLQLGTKAGKFKTVGAILCVAGALTIGLYQGKSFYIGHHSTHDHPVISQKAKPNWTRGTVFLVGSILSYGMWFIVQQTVTGLCLDRKMASWSLGWNLQLVTIIYSGVLASAVSFCLISWAVINRGPTYPSMFNPLSLIFVAMTEALFLGEAITVGSLMGMSLIIVGLYSFLWGKSKELKTVPQPEAVAGEASMMVPESVAVAAIQSTAIIMPAANFSSQQHNPWRISCS